MAAEGLSIPELLQFPCDHVFKVFGDNVAAGSFEAAVFRAVNEVLPVARDAMKSRVSGKGHYRCVSVVVRVESMEQVAALYTALRGLDGLRFLL